MTVNQEKLGRFLLRGLRIGASTVSIVELLHNDWTGGISAGRAVMMKVAELTDRRPGIHLSSEVSQRVHHPRSPGSVQHWTLSIA